MRFPTSPKLTGLVALAVALPLTLAGCADSSTSTGPTTTVRHQGSSAACALVAPAQIETTLGKHVDEPVAFNSTAATTCTYHASHGGVVDTVIISYRGKVSSAQAGAEQAALGKLHGTLTPVDVSSGQAFSYTSGSGANRVTSLVTLVGETQVTITADATVDQLENLSQEIFAAFAGQAKAAAGPAAPTGSATTAAG